MKSILPVLLTVSVCVNIYMGLSSAKLSKEILDRPTAEKIITVTNNYYGLLQFIKNYNSEIRGASSRGGFFNNLFGPGSEVKELDLSEWQDPFAERSD